jgi:hypothetical protein
MTMNGTNLQLNGLIFWFLCLILGSFFVICR